MYLKKEKKKKGAKSHFSKISRNAEFQNVWFLLFLLGLEVVKDHVPER